MVINSLVASLRNIVRAFFNFSITSSRGLTGSPLEGSNINYAGNINWAFLIIPNLLVVIGVSGLVINLVKKKEGLLGSSLRYFVFLAD